MGRCILAALAVVATASVAHAEPARVEVRPLAGETVPPELVDTLRIHLGASATVAVGAPLAGATLEQRISEASAALGDAALVTWLERAPAKGGGYTVVVVGQRDGRAAVEVGRLDGEEATAMSRLLALRIGAFLDETLAAGPSSPLAPPAPRASRAPPTPPAHMRPIAEVGGGGLGDTSGFHAEAGIAGGVRRTVGGYLVEAVALGRFGWPRERETADGRVAMDLVDIGAGGRFVVPVGPIWLGATAELGARRVSADAMTPDGESGAAVRWLPVARIGVDGRIELGTRISIRAVIGVERGLEVERFTVRGAEMSQVGTLAGLGTLSVVVPL